MKLVLRPFQEQAVDDLCWSAAQASAEVAKVNNQQALILSAPTGSGKTVIAARLMERVLQGDAENDPCPEATFLWLTDQPELNEQTRRKIEDVSDVFDDTLVQTIEAGDFDQRVFSAGKLYFLNTQKLGKNSLLVSGGDKRGYTIWETIANTVAERPATFWLIIDEAHRGMDLSGAKENRSLVQRLIRGDSSVQLPPVPLVFGVSATPERFKEMLKDTDRIQRPCHVSADDVRNSGLLKDSITLYHTDEDQPSDYTLLAAAAEQLDGYSKTWGKYCAQESEADVRPILVVQVQDGTKTKLTNTDLGRALTVVEKALGPLSPGQAAQCFNDVSAVQVDDDHVLPYIKPSDIQDDPDLRVVFFKMALTTGWDCPRAEVMMSFRTAKDDTLIAQLVGRMVRTPLARQIADSDLLNTVALYLPYYDRDELDAVIAKLSDPDPDNGLAGTEVKEGNKLVTLKADPKRKEAFAAAKGLPLYRVERVSKQSPLRRLMRLGRYLAWDDIDKGAAHDFEDELVAKLDEERERIKDTKSFQALYDEAGRITVRSGVKKLGDGGLEHEQIMKLPVVDQNVDDAFADAGRKLGGGVHISYMKDLAARKGAPPLAAIKREVFALTQDPSVLDAVEKHAEQVCATALKQHEEVINLLPEGKRAEYRRIRRQAAVPTHEPWNLPAEIEGPKEGTKYEKHLYVKPSGGYTCTLNDWEAQVVKEQIADDTVIGWLRNEPRKPWALSLPYFDGEDKPMYPDFLVFRKVGKKVVCDILEPHALSFADSAAKAKGLAEFAIKHGEQFGRIELITKLSAKKLVRLDLKDPQTAQKVRSVSNNEGLKGILEAV